MTGYVERDIAAAVLTALHDMPVTVITGMRQTGKSTFLQNNRKLKTRLYVSLDDFAQLEAAKSDPDGFVSSGEPMTIDEVQKCPELLTAIKRAVDKKRSPGQFLLSGSANLSMLKGVSESLAGRAIYFTMHPFTRREIAGAAGESPFIRKFFAKQELSKAATQDVIKAADVLQGGMPSVCLGEVKNRRVWFKGFEQTYLERDVRELSQVGNIISFRNLLHLTALRTGQLLSPSQLGRDAKLNAVTTSRYLSLFEASFIIQRMSPYLKNRASRLIKSQKMYLNDSGLACYLSGIESGEKGLLKGSMFETYVAQDLSGIINALWPEASLFFWHVQGRYEVDFIIEAGNRCLAIEVKSAARWDDRDLAGIRAFLSATPHCIAGLLAYNGTEMVKLGNRLWAVPLGQLLS
ncbi:MAG TPA: ATP-binding protein [Dissulfurispiraceae bacterium]|nr:ATP-binding protein [Dissulfurispiraceae bacterium]